MNHSGNGKMFSIQRNEMLLYFPTSSKFQLLYKLKHLRLSNSSGDERKLKRLRNTPFVRLWQVSMKYNLQSQFIYNYFSSHLSKIVNLVPAPTFSKIASICTEEKPNYLTMWKMAYILSLSFFRHSRHCSLFLPVH